MDEAVRTTASAAETWAIIVVVVIVLAFMILAPMAADLVQHRENEDDRDNEEDREGDGDQPDAAPGWPPVPAPRTSAADQTGPGQAGSSLAGPDAGHGEQEKQEKAHP